MADRKPDPTVTPPKTTDDREPAQNVLNKFLKEQGILIGTKPSGIEQTEKGSIIIGAPAIIAVYVDQVRGQSGVN